MIKYIKYARKLISLFGFFGALKFMVARVVQVEKIRIKIIKQDCYIWIRPNNSDIRVASEIFLSDELEFDWPYDAAPRRVIDAGANVGFASLVFSRRWPDASVVALEPDEENYNLAMLNVGRGGSVSLIQEGLWFENKRIKVKGDSLRLGAWALAFEPADDSDPTAVQATSIPKLMERLGWDQCDLVKIDIEGAEIDIFKNDVSWLNNVRSVLIEPHGDEARNLILRAASKFHMRVTEEGEKMFLTHS